MALWKQIFILTFTAVLVACSHTTTVTPEATPPAAPGLSAADVSEAMVWGASDNVRRIKHIYISSQPDDTALHSAKAAGVTTVINLREPHELDWDEQASVEALGMSYVNVSIPKSGDSLDADALQEIERVVMQNHDGAVLLHCSSGNRGAAWLAAHLAGTHGMGTADALAIAEKAGLTHASTRERVLIYLGSN